ncbi:hypothetical protein TSMG0120 [Halocynthia phage JM-2012]|uniref:hypothetical protein n=1 Tax=Halocynthia phage JM-2012 TaxID=1173297 RepID=UPI00025C694C|nr:hypothetical protein TSMG0120 [Halocynthia phage JM-2012]AFI55403.1 hypothetical protein TSMG0120 [Halocynthia phage JM-2012]
MANNEFVSGTFNVRLSKGKFLFTYRCNTVLFSNRDVERDVELFVDKLTQCLRSLKPKVSESTSRTVVSCRLSNNVMLEIVVCTLTNTILSMGLSDLDLKTNVSIVFLDRVVEIIDLSDGYEHSTNNLSTDEKAISMFVESICESISNISMVNSIV